LTSFGAALAQPVADEVEVERAFEVAVAAVGRDQVGQRHRRQRGDRPLVRSHHPVPPPDALDLYRKFGPNVVLDVNTDPALRPAMLHHAERVDGRPISRTWATTESSEDLRQ
jgi:hypothetical protein